ncbi:MAG TPA: winged helix-turn-helix transcriptional regulator [Nitrososphaerales archaeon]|nr:winged helix-turn-helix transcriptional regulator [Nitrososphaerales archaeon]
MDPTQKRVLEYVTDHPGVHLRELCREVGLAMGAAQYHVGRLEKEGRIHSVRRGLYRFFFPAALFGERQRDVLGMLSLERPREILLNLVENPGSSQERLATATGVSQPTVSWHLKRLIELGIVERHQAGRAVTYSVFGGGSEVAAFIKTYHPTVWERWSSRLADIFIAYSEGVDA